MPRSDKLNHCCMQWMRSMVSSAKGAAALALGVIRGDEIDQCSPGNHEFHLGQQFLLARLLGTQVQTKAALLHGREVAIAC